jgi:hypothetical protein
LEIGEKLRVFGEEHRDAAHDLVCPARLAAMPRKQLNETVVLLQAGVDEVSIRAF